MQSAFVPKMTDFTTWGPVLLAAGLLCLTYIALASRPGKARMLGSALSIVLALRYIHWRLWNAVPLEQTWWQEIWVFCFVALETGVVASSILTSFFLSRSRDRTAEADSRQNSKLLSAPVDVFIVTYNEDRAILERTIVGATALEHPDIRIWVLDDGAREWVKELATELGAHYISRVKGKHAKAGNVNNGLRHALAFGRKPAFALLLDADFVPNRKLLKRTLGLFEEYDVGIVQTPQHFFNPDPLQSNLLCTSAWPDEQRFFFDVYLAAKDAWGTAYCCGTSAVFRVEALEHSGGLATETVTEDMLTTFKFSEHGYRTIFLNEALSLGLAPEGLKEYVSQRSRWCLGTIQQIFTRWSFWGRGKLSFVQRLSVLDSVLFWAVRAPFRLMLLSSPMLYWWTHTSVIRATLPELIYWMAPSIVCDTIFMSFVSRNKILPIITEVSQLAPAFAICRTLAGALIRPFGHPFKVTAKGISTTGTTIQWNLLCGFAAIGIVTLTGMVLNISQFNPMRADTGYTLNVIVTMFNTVILGLVIAACVEPPRRRKNERFSSDQAVSLRLNDGRYLRGKLENISIGGASMVANTTWSGLDRKGELLLDSGELVLPFRVIRCDTNDLSVEFELSTEMRRNLTKEIFTGKFSNELTEVRAAQVFRSLARVLVS
jgi:cellulose synthase (UDP-forming)